MFSKNVPDHVLLESLADSKAARNAHLAVTLISAGALAVASAWASSLASDLDWASALFLACLFLSQSAFVVAKKTFSV